MAEQYLTTPRGVYELRRPHTDPSSPLRAWSAADQLALVELGTDALGRLLIVNDEFGALTCGLADGTPTVWTDSALSRAAIDANLEANDFDALAADRSIPGDHSPVGVFDTIVVRVPKTSALLDYQLRALQACSKAESRILGTGMVRHIHNSTVESFETLVGPTTTSRATRKARLIHAQRTEGAAAATAQLAMTEFATGDGVRVAEYPGTFSSGHLDIGSALLLEVLAAVPAPDPGTRVVDLGCGNGVLSATMAARWPEADFLLFDVSDLAVAAATKTWELNELESAMVANAADGFGDTADSSVDVVITNPPFHQGHALDHEMTDRLLADTARVLRETGRAYVVAQRHMNLHTRMKRWFSSVEVVSKHPSHVVLRATDGA